MPSTPVDFNPLPLLNGCPMAVVVTDGQGRIVSAVGGLLLELGWNEADLIGRTYESTLATNSSPTLPTNGRRRSSRYQIRFRSAQGRLIDVEDEVTRLPVAGKLAWFVHVVRPLGSKPTTAPSASDSSIRVGRDWRVRAHHLRTLLDQLPVAIACFNRAGEFQAGNLAAQMLLAARPGESPPPARWPKELPASIGRCLESLATTAEKGVEWELGGERRYYDWRLQPLGSSEPNRTPGGVLAVFVDVTDRVRGEQGLRQAVEAAEGASRRKSQFLSAISHDLRTPVNAINIQVELLQTLLDLDSPSWDEIRDQVRVLGRAVSNLNELLHDLLDLSRFEAGRFDDRPTLFAVDAWLDSVVAPHEAAAHAKGLNFTWRVSGCSETIRCDRVKLTRILSNLIDNAVKFTEQGSVDVSARLLAESGQLILRVRDTGPGIPADQFERIFDEFAQLNNPARDRSRGTGLGLAICRRLVDGAGGVISVESRLGQGTLFQVRYPVEVVKAADEAAAGSGRASLPASRALPDSPLLIIEDKPQHQETALALVLTQTGHAVSAVASGAEAAQWLRDHRASLIVLDLDRPGLEAAQILGPIREQPSGRNVPILVLANDLGDDPTTELSALPVDAVLQKPVDVGQLVETISRLLSRSGAAPAA
ncbi:MAG: hypothetical protein KatS3mg108_2278 [Isosphaeraceae bacterium]|nr:MAG: hypothetical protein KatS3mg108_2278 [Isosphaeraceae bacterium]